MSKSPGSGRDATSKIEKKTLRFAALVGQFLYREEFCAQARQRPQAFTRHRKVGVIGVVSIILNMVRKTTQVEWDEYLERVHPGGEAMTYTKQSFAEARQNLRPEAFTLLNTVLIQGYYAEGDYATYRGFRWLAVDGSVLELPNTPALREQYGTSENQSEHGALARARSSALYDILNGLAIHTIRGRYDRSERDMAKEHLSALLQLTPSDIPNLVLFDRGYPSADLIWWLQAHHIRFVMRVSTGFYPEIGDATEPDSIVTIRITLRFLKVTLPSGEIETLITELTPAELPYAQTPSLYFRRWGLEMHYDDLKNKFEVENFSRAISPWWWNRIFN